MTGWYGTTGAASTYPGLGFDPLPGDPVAVERLAADARRIGARLEDAANRLARLAAPYGWHGEAADAFTASLQTLPRDLGACAHAYQRLATELDRFRHGYVDALARARRLDAMAVAARDRLRTARLQADPWRGVVTVGRQPVQPAPIAATITAVEHELATVLRAARGLRAELEDAMRPVARSIRELAGHAPAEPGWHELTRLARALLPVTPIGAAVAAVDRLAGEVPEFFDDLADLLGTVSGVLGVAAALTFWMPGVGQTLGVLALATSGGAALVKTSLYLHDARDQDGRPYVPGAELATAWAGTAVAAIGPAAGAAAAMRSGARLGPALAGQLALAGPGQLRLQAAAVTALVRDRGPLGAATQVARTESIGWRAMDAAQRTGYLVSRGTDGLGLPSAFGVARLPGQVVRLATDHPETPDLRAGRQPRIRPRPRGVDE